MNITDWLALEERYKFKFPADFFPLYEELEKWKFTSDWKSDGLDTKLYLATPEDAENWWNRAADPDLLPIIYLATGDQICLRLPLRLTDPTVWVQTEYEGGMRASLGRSFAGVIRLLAAYLDAWSLDCSSEIDEIKKSQTLFSRSRQLLENVDGILTDGARAELLRSRSWTLGAGRSPITARPTVVMPSMAAIIGAKALMNGHKMHALKTIKEAVEEDPLFGAGHWGLGAIYAIEGRIVEACHEWSQLFEMDLRTALPILDSNFGEFCGEVPQAMFWHAAAFLRRHPDEYLANSRNRTVATIILGDGFNKMEVWLAGLKDAMKNGSHDDALPIAQSLLATYSPGEWFPDGDDCDSFDTCSNALSVIYSAAGLGCRVKGKEK